MRGAHNAFLLTLLPPADLHTPSGATSDCIFGGPRLYHTVDGDTYEKTALRLNITTQTLTSNASPGQYISAVRDPGQCVKIPQCQPSECIIQPHTFDEAGVYKGLAEKSGTTARLMHEHITDQNAEDRWPLG
ncbi:hypothetical protein AC579_6421 [Pseudocercospora musae]|uniref:LysM domain-containing protein n=1 Tax=Pseudocercospora musae TaxID=113226 RepID=A0A139I3U3_9PEZI|nr:hypothetical protein AC579_6421 [Pseudocercospora musae]